MGEIWKPIKGYEGLYSVSSFGRIKSNMRISSNGRSLSTSILDGNIKNKYRIVGLCKNAKSHGFRVHRLVARAFIPNPEDKNMIIHKDGDKSNNNIDNLIWSSQKQYTEYGKGNKVASTRKVTAYDKNNRMVNTWPSIKEASIDLNISYGNLCYAEMKGTIHKKSQLRFEFDKLKYKP